MQHLIAQSVWFVNAKAIPPAIHGNEDAAVPLGITALPRLDIKHAPLAFRSEPVRTVSFHGKSLASRALYPRPALIFAAKMSRVQRTRHVSRVREVEVRRTCAIAESSVAQVQRTCAASDIS